MYMHTFSQNNDGKRKHTLCVRCRNFSGIVYLPCLVVTLNSRNLSVKYWHHFYTSSIYELEVMMLFSVNAKVLNRLYQSSDAYASLVYIFVVQIQQNYAFNSSNKASRSVSVSFNAVTGCTLHNGVLLRW